MKKIVAVIIGILFFAQLYAQEDISVVVQRDEQFQGDLKTTITNNPLAKEPTSPAVGEAIYTLSGDSITEKNKFVDSFYVENTNTLTPYVLKKTVNNIITSSTYGNISLKLSKFNGYEEDEPGICNVIDVFNNGTQLLRLATSMGFESISTFVKSQTGDYILRNLTVDTYALVFYEWIYGTDIPHTTIILIYKGQAKLVYNKKMYIRLVTNTSATFRLNLQANRQEWISPTTPDRPAELYQLWWDGSVLRFQ
jgi:hypothetical protein